MFNVGDRIFYTSIREDLKFQTLTEKRVYEVIRILPNADSSFQHDFELINDRGQKLVPGWRHHVNWEREGAPVLSQYAELFL